MKKPNPKAYGQDNELWDNGGKEAYEAALNNWKEYMAKYGAIQNKPGRQRARPIHPSWNTVLQHFNPSDPTRSQGAFCRAMGLNRATFSAMQCKQMPLYISIDVARWVEELTVVGKTKEVENG